MSGLEAAGLALGAFPILVKAAQGINTELGRVHDWWDFGTTFDELVFRIEAQKSLYRQNLQLLVELLGIQDAESESLLKGTSLDIWEQPHIQRSLWARFDEEGCTLIKRRLRAMYHAIAELQALLPLNKLYDTNLIKAEFKRACVSFSSDADRLITRIGCINNELDTFLEKEYRNSKFRRHKQPFFPLSLVQSRADLYHQRLRECWSCSCLPAHRVGVTLHHEKNELVMSRSRNYVHTLFEHNIERAYFVVDADPAEQVSTKTVPETTTLSAWDLALSEKAPYGTANHSDGQEDSPSKHEQSNASEAGAGAVAQLNKRYPSIKFRLTEATKTMWKSTARRSRSSFLSRRGHSPMEQSVGHKSPECEAKKGPIEPGSNSRRQTGHSGHNRVRFADSEPRSGEHEERIVHGHIEVLITNACSINAALGDHEPDQVLIKLGLPGDKQVKLKPTLPTKAYQGRAQDIHDVCTTIAARCVRMEVSLRLTLTLLSFATTPWLMESFNKHDLFVLMGEDGHQLDEWSGPYISFRPKHPPVETQILKQPRQVRKTVLLLGVMLLELFHGQAIETTSMWNANTVNGEVVGSTMFYVANQWLAKSSGDFDGFFGPEIGTSIASAISKCLRFRFDNEGGADEVNLAQVLYREIFTPMEEGVPLNYEDD